MGQRNYTNGFEVTLHEDSLALPLRWRKPQTIFVNSMSDLFHESVPDDFILRVFEIMDRANWHRYQVLTKRSDRLLALSPAIKWTGHVWMGVSVESPSYLFRVDDLRRTGAKVKFLSLEPLLAALPELKLAGIDWAIVGGESGPGARIMKESWVLDIRDQCTRAGVAFFFKQWGGVNKKRSGRILEGRIWDEMPNSEPELKQLVVPDISTPSDQRAGSSF
jgi:protein gp37